MAEIGIKTTLLGSTSTIASVLRNSDGGTFKVSLVDFARQITGLAPEGTDEWLHARHWAQKEENVPVLEGQFSVFHHAVKVGAYAGSAGLIAIAASSDVTSGVISATRALAAPNATGPVKFTATTAQTGLSADDVVVRLADKTQGELYIWNGTAFWACAAAVRPRCSVPRFDGAIVSQEWKEALCPARQHI